MSESKIKGDRFSAVYYDEIVGVDPGPIPPTMLILKGGRFLTCSSPDLTLWQRFVRWWKSL